LSCTRRSTKTPASVDFPLPDAPVTRRLGPRTGSVTGVPSSSAPTAMLRGRNGSWAASSQESTNSRTPAPFAARVTRSASAISDGIALPTATAKPARRRKAWSFSASPTPIALCGGHAEAAEHLLETALLRDGRRQHHDGLAIEDDLQLEPEVVDGAQDGRLVRHLRRDDDATGRERHARPLERGEKGRGGRRREVVHPFGSRLVEHGAVLRDDPVEEVELGTDLQQVVEPPSGDEDDAAARIANAPQRREGLRRDAAVGRECPVVVAGEHVVPHPSRRYRGSGGSGRGRHRPKSCPRCKPLACFPAHAAGRSGCSMLDALPPLVPLRLPEPRRRDVRRRAAATVRTAVRHLRGTALRRLFRRPEPAQDVARALRRTFEALGATYVKLGQLVASAPGVFGETVADEFRSCLDTGPPVPFAARASDGGADPRPSP